MGLLYHTSDTASRPDEKEQYIMPGGRRRPMNVVAPAQLDGGADYYSRAVNDRTIHSQQLNDLLPYCTTEPPLSQAQVIASSDVVGSLKELVVLALGAASGVPGSMEKLEGAVGSQAAVNIVEFFADEWEIEG
ncbi:hypothetical protein J4E80_005947 [Alternaria sp. BMP 0032]|nr:hypothetical protein J4E80_005947 [Alternaria sp. BMP 0032]